MSYTTSVSDIFRSYSIILEEGIPSILNLISAGKNRSLISIQNDKSVTITKSLGDKVIDCLERQQELENLFNTVNKVLETIDDNSKCLLIEYFCYHKTLSEALKSADCPDYAAFDYAKALFAFHHPGIDFDETEFDSVCKALKTAADKSSSLRERFSAFSNSVLSDADQYFDLANRLEQIDADQPNSNYLKEVPHGNTKFYRRRTQLLCAMFYSLYPDSDFAIILKILREGQGQVGYLQRLFNSLHPEQL